MNYKIGIDLATKKTGIVILDNENTLIKQALIETRTWNQEKSREIINDLKRQFGNIFNDFINNVLEENDEVIFTIELGRHRTFQTFFGIYIMLIDLNFFNNQNKKIKIKYKTIDPTSWQKKIGCETWEVSKVRKERARQYAKQNEPLISDNQDIIDAYCIARTYELWNKVK